MKTATITLSPFPPHAGISFDVPLHSLVPSRFFSRKKPELAADLIAWCITRILNEQFDVNSGDVSGAWSNRYASAVQAFFGNEAPEYFSKKESITYSCWIASGLAKYRSQLADPELALTIRSRLEHFLDYLTRHQDAETKGFGLARVVQKLREEYTIIEPDLRHSATAVSALWHLDPTDHEATSVFATASCYLTQQLRQLTDQDQRGITYASLHGLIVGERTLAMPATYESRCRAVIERGLVRSFDHDECSWDLDRDPSRLRIDNALFVLRTIAPDSSISRELRSCLQRSVDWLCDDCLQETEDKQTGLPMAVDEDPDLGPSIQLLYILSRFGGILDINQSRLDSTYRFVVNPSTREHYARFAYAWDLASALELAVMNA